MTFKNLVINGCSFTAEKSNDSWATYVNQKFNPDLYKNIARPGAGNFYIANSTIDYLSNADLDPAETMVTVMWSGTGRKDIRISGEWYYHLKNQYFYRAKSFSDNESEYYLFSGGLYNSWNNHPVIRKIFEWSYKISDPVTLCKDSLINIISLESYLRAHGYQYKFAGYVDCWSNLNESSSITGDYCLGHFLHDLPMYNKYNFDSWMFADNQKTCLGEFAKSLNQLNATNHPTAVAHKLFADTVIIPQLLGQ